MTAARQHTKLSNVKRLGSLLMSLLFFIPSTISAQPTVTVQQYDERSSKDLRCNKLRDDHKAAMKTIQDSCTKAGYSAIQNCQEKAISCQDAASEVSASTLEALTSAIGLAYTDPTRPKNECPVLNATDYKDRKAALEKRLREVNKELKELTTEQADVQKEFDKTVADLQEALSQANQDLEEAKVRLGEEEREKITEFQTAQKDAASTIRTKQSELIELRSQVTAKIRERAAKLLELTSETANYSCTKEYNQVIKDFGSTKSTSSSGHIKRGKTQKSAALDVFNKCMDRFHQMRIRYNETHTADMEKLNKQIANTESDIADIDDNISLASSQLTEIKASFSKQKETAEKKVSDLLTLTQSKITSAQTELKTRMDGVSQDQAALQKELNSVNNELMTLAAPPSGAEYTLRQAHGAINSGVAETVDLEQEFASLSCTGTLGNDSLKKLRSGGTKSSSSSGSSKSKNTRGSSSGKSSESSKASQ